MAIVSTVPGAIQTFQAYMQTVANNNPSLNIGVYLGEPIDNVRDNFMAVGSFQEWTPIMADSYEWAAIPGQSLLRSEKYTLQGVIRALAGDVDPMARLSDAFTMLNALHEQIITDIKGISVLGPGTLSGPGSWGGLQVHMEAFGPLEGSGYGVVLGLELDVINVQISG